MAVSVYVSQFHTLLSAFTRCGKSFYTHTCRPNGFQSPWLSTFPVKHLDNNSQEMYSKMLCPFDTSFRVLDSTDYQSIGNCFNIA